MDSDSINQVPDPKLLKTLTSEVKYPNKNNLLHQFVVDNSYPNNSFSESHINAVLLSIAGSAVDVNGLNVDGYTPLHLTVLKNNLLMVKKLLSCLVKIDVNARCNENEKNTALHLAAVLGHFSLIQELLNTDADVNIKNEYGDTALHFAETSGRFDPLKFFVSKGAHKVQINGERANLHFTAQSGNIEIMKFLVSNGADVNVKNRRGSTPLHYASLSGDLAAVDFLVSNGADVNAKDEIGLTALHKIASSGNLATVESLVKNGADVNAKCESGWTPLHKAARLGDLATVRFLVSNGADTKARNTDGVTPLFFAERKGHLDIIKFLSDTIKSVELNSRLEKFKSYKLFSRQMRMQ